jgi:hypothetical protein
MLEMQQKNKKGKKVHAVFNQVGFTGADPGFQVRGGAHKKNCAERREVLKFLGYFV